MLNRLILACGICCLPAWLLAQGAGNSSGIFHRIKQLQNSTRILYIAAHPDDENTRMISWLVNDKFMETAYLSLTRGDGGQNLIGTELGAELGVIRTQELMQARALDGGKQYFSRAVDFGYSKNPEETLEKWGKEEVLADVVWTIRRFHPDIIITRFPPDSRGGHGHHTASAMLAIEAFALAADPKAYPEQLQYVNSWRTKRIYWNASSWWNPKLDSLAKIDSNILAVEVGGYNSLLGYSSNELASLSRTQHKSQGFGVSVARGREMEYLEYLAGERAEAEIFEGISPAWSRFEFSPGDKLLREIIGNYQFEHPEKSVPALLKLKRWAAAISDTPRRDDFRRKIDEIIGDALGLYAEALLSREYFTYDEDLSARLELIVRNPTDTQHSPLQLAEVKFRNTILWEGEQKPLTNEKLTLELSLPPVKGSTEPYWLRMAYENLFQVPDISLLGKAEDNEAQVLQLKFNYQGEEFYHRVPLVHKYSDRVEGEIIKEVNIIPDFTIHSDVDNIIYTDLKERELNLEVRSQRGGSAILQLEAEGWEIKPDSLQLNIAPHAAHMVKLKIRPLEGAGSTTLKVSLNGEEATALKVLDYEHIDRRIIVDPLKVQLVKLNLRRQGEIIGYIPGAGDKVAEAIAHMGYKVEILDEEKLKTQNLSRYQAIVAGVRAYNTQAWLPAVKPILENYMKQGGIYLVQYNTSSRDLLSDDIGPYPFTISRERVTEEDAQAEFLIPSHPIFNKPNQISPGDFENWVQERGLYFAGEWDDRYRALIGWQDGEEPQRQGGLIIGDYGKGAFIYTGISFFRELPAGVEGAYRLLANLLSYKPVTANEP